MIYNIDNIASYGVPHDSSNVLGKGLSSMSVLKKICFIGQKAKGNACQYFEAVTEGVDLALYAQVVVEGIAVKIAELRGISL